MRRRISPTTSSRRTASRRLATRGRARRKPHRVSLKFSTTSTIVRDANNETVATVTEKTDPISGAAYVDTEAGIQQVMASIMADADLGPRRRFPRRHRVQRREPQGELHAVVLLPGIAARGPRQPPAYSPRSSASRQRVHHRDIRDTERAVRDEGNVRQAFQAATAKPRRMAISRCTGGPSPCRRTSGWCFRTKT